MGHTYWQTIDHDSGVTEIFGRDLTNMPSDERDMWLDRAFCYWRRRGFPYPKLSTMEVEREFERLTRVQSDEILVGGKIRSSTVGLRLANSFHPQMWSVPVHGRSPVECFEDDESLRKVLIKAAHFWPDRRCWNPQCIRSVLRVFHRARVSNFRPTVARAIIERFSTTGQRVVDFSAGYGGRLLGALTLSRYYVGIDPAQAQVAGLKKMAASLKKLAGSAVEIHQACAEDFLQQLPPGETGLVFSSPPYYDLEKYSTEETQSFIRYSTYAEWKKRFLETVLVESHRLLQRGGYLIINIADVGRYPLATDANTIAKRIFGKDAGLFRMMISAMPEERARGKRHYRWEPILIWKK